MSPERQKKVRRLVLLHPDCDFLEVWTCFNSSTIRARDTIRDATRQALEDDTQVRWLRAPMLNAVFGQPESSGGWVRIRLSQAELVAKLYSGPAVTKWTLRLAESTRSLTMQAILGLI